MRAKSRNVFARFFFHGGSTNPEDLKGASLLFLLFLASILLCLHTIQGNIAMWLAIGLGITALCIVTCVKLMNAHELTLLKRKQDHEIAKSALRDDL